MKYRLCLITSLATLAAPFTPFIQAQDAPPVDVVGILNSLKTIGKQQAADNKAGKMKIAQQFLAASRDSTAAITMYEEAIRATKFEGMSRESTQFQEWKKGEIDKMKSKQFRDGLSLHLQYLAMTMERSAGIEVKDLLADLVGYTQQVAVEEDTPASPTFTPFGKPGKKPGEGNSDADEWLKPPLSSSIFVKWQLLSDYVSAVEGWEMVPGNVDGIFSKTILPEFRKTKDARLTQYWDTRIARESSLATRSGKNYDADKFNLIVMPNLLWSRAQELLALDQKNRAIMDMVKNIKSYPTHPNVPQWISQVQQILQPAPAALADAVPAPAAAPAAPAAAPAVAARATPGAVAPPPVTPGEAAVPAAPVGNPTPTQ